MINGFERFLQHKSLCFKTYNLFSISQPPLPSKPTPLTLFILNIHIYTSPEKFYIREYTSGSLRKNWNISFALLTQLIWQFGVNSVFVLTPKSAVKSRKQTRSIISSITTSLLKPLQLHLPNHVNYIISFLIGSVASL